MASRLVFKVHDEKGTYIAACASPLQALILCKNHEGWKVRHRDWGVIWRETPDALHDKERLLFDSERLARLNDRIDAAREERCRKLDKIYGATP